MPFHRTVFTHRRRLLLGGLLVALMSVAGAAFLLNDADSAERQVVSVDTADRSDEDRASRDLTRTPPPETPTTTPTPKPSVASRLEKTTPPKPPAPVRTTESEAVVTAVGCGSYTGNRRTACSLLPSFGFSTAQMPALDKLWDHESGWNHRAKNPSSGAFGIPQALPANKMASAGSDWATNAATQIKWGLGYIKNRYGSPNAAWAFWQSHNWY